MAEPITTILSLVAGYAFATWLEVKASEPAKDDDPRDDTLYDMTRPMKPLDE